MLIQLESLVLNTRLTPEQVHQIRAQLATLAPKTPEVESILSSLISPRIPPAIIPQPSFIPSPNLASLVGGIDPNLLARLGGLQDLLSKSAASSTAGSNSGTPAAEVKVEVGVKVNPTSTKEVVLDLLVQEYDRAVLESGVLLTNANILKYVNLSLNLWTLVLTASIH